jgi:hypothetical protein
MVDLLLVVGLRFATRDNLSCFLDSVSVNFSFASVRCAPVEPPSLMEGHIMLLLRDLIDRRVTGIVQTKPLCQVV